MATPSVSSPLEKALMHETVWLRQNQMEKAEEAFRLLCLQDNGQGSDTQTDESLSECGDLPLALESIWFKQQIYEDAEAWCQKVTTGTADPSSLPKYRESTPSTPTKRPHIQDGPLSKKLKPEISGNAWENKLHEEISSLKISAKNIHKHLDEFEKTQHRKAQAIQDTVLRLNNAIEACQNRLNEELTQSSEQISWFHNQLQDIDSVIVATSKNLQGGNMGQRRRLAPFCKSMVEHMSKVDCNLNQCIETCKGLQAEVPKSDINRIVGEIGKLSLFKKKQGVDKFHQKKEVVEKILKDLMSKRLEFGKENSFDLSDSSMEGNVSSSFSTPIDSDREEDTKEKQKKGKWSKKNRRRTTSQRGSAQPQTTANRNNSSATAATKPQTKQVVKGKNSANVNGQRENQTATPKKRNSQGSQSAAGQKKEEVFKFKGNSQSPKGQHATMPGILGPRPNPFGLADIGQQGAFSLQNFNTMNHVPQARYPYAGSGNFRFSGLQHNGVSGLQNPLPSNMSFNGVGNQFQQNLGRDPGVGFPYRQGPSGNFGGNVEQQLNDIAQKLRQMQLAASQDFQIQQLMQETQRLKQILAQKQHSHQPQHPDRFEQQFKVLINAFQQQLQAQQPPEAKMAKSIPPHHQRMFHNRQHLHQQQKRQKQQQNKQQSQKPETEPQQQSDNQRQINTQRGVNDRRAKQGSPGTSATKKKGVQRKWPSKNSKIIRIGMFNPYASGEKHRAGVSSLVVLEDMGCLVVVDIINSCLKLYDVSDDGSSSNSLNHRLVTRLDIPRPYYMTQLTKDEVVISRAGNVLSVVKVTKRRLEFVRDLATDVQYYGLTFIENGVVACAAFKDNQIDMVCIQENLIETATVVNNCKGPELVASLSATRSIVFVERTPEVCIRLVCVSTAGKELFANDLGSETSDVWNVACIGDRIVCSSKGENKLKLYSKDGNSLADLSAPGGTVKKPFAMAFSENGNLYVANDGAWDEQYEHSVTTEINVFAFS